MAGQLIRPNSGVPVQYDDGAGKLYNVSLLVDQNGNPLAPSGTPVLGAGEAHLGSVGGATLPVDSLFAMTGVAGLAATLPSTPVAYTLGAVMGTAFAAAVGRVNGGSGIILSAALMEVMNASALANAAVTCTSASPAVFTLAAHGLLVGNRVRLGGTAVPTGFVAGTTYYVQSVTTNTFTLSATLGGAAINSSSTGTAVTVTEVSGQLNCTLLLNKNTWVATATDSTLFDPTYADQKSMKAVPIQFNNWSVPGNINQASGAQTGGRMATANAPGLNLGYKCIGGSQVLNGVLLFNGSAGQILSPHAELVVRLTVSQD